MRATIKSTPAHFIRSEQSGDWFYDEDTFIVFVRDDMTKDSQLAVAIHELIEAYLCRKHGVTDESVVAFDNQYEAERKEGKHKDEDEPGDDPAAPYRQEHMMATHVERAVCHALGLTWHDHERQIIEPAPVPPQPDSATSHLRMESHFAPPL